MISRTFHSLREHPDAYRRVEYPDGRDWRARSVLVVEGYEGGTCESNRTEHATMVDARKAAQGIIAQWLADGWQEVMRTGRPAAVRPASARPASLLVSAADMERLAAEIAGTLPAAPDWPRVWERLAIVPNAVQRRAALKLVQERHRDVCNEAARMERLRAMAERMKAAEQATARRVKEDETLARMLASQGGAAATDRRQRRIDFSELPEA